MTDYTRNTGNSGIMLIRDFWPGSNQVEFWLTSNNTTTWNAALPWGYTVNGVVWNGTYNYQPGVGWRRLGVFTVNTGQTVQFRLGNSGTSGFGGPTTFNVTLPRSTVTPAPTIVTLTNITHNSMAARFDANGDGGSPTLEWQLGYGLDPNTPQTIITYSSVPTNVSGLSPGLTYYFWGRGRNALGTGPWGPRGSATTLRVPDPPGTVRLEDITQTTGTAYFAPSPNNGGAAISQYEVGWTTSPTGNPTASTPAVSPQAITGLFPATTYYFRARARNSVGWSPWSNPPIGGIKTKAGARVKDGPVWKDAIPWVKIDGDWELAKTWVRQAGVWRETL